MDGPSENSIQYIAAPPTRVGEQEVLRESIYVFILKVATSTLSGLLYGVEVVVLSPHGPDLSCEAGALYE